MDAETLRPSAPKLFIFGPAALLGPSGSCYQARVKHFKSEPRGKRRLHKKPNAYEIDRCRWWLDREIAVIQPQLAVALGATAARGLLATRS